MSDGVDGVPVQVAPSDGGTSRTGQADYPPTPLAGVDRSRPDLPGGPRKGINWGDKLGDLLVPLLAIITALAIGAIIILATGANVFKAYGGLFRGAFGDWTALANTLVEATPFIFAGLAVALGFKCGLFNIGAEGQLAIGSMFAAVAGYSITGLPIYIHLPLALIIGALGGALWGAIPGFLRAKTGAHEVITTIMLNYIAIRLTDYLIKGPFRDPVSSAPQTPAIQQSAELPYLFGVDYRLHAGFILAIALAFGVWWLLNKTTIGFEIRTVGSNPDAAQYAGMSITRNFVLAMSLSGALAGLAGVSQVLGLQHTLKSSFTAGYGFDSIAVALLARSNPLAVIPAALFWGALRQGAGLMQTEAHISKDLINIIQGLVIAFIAADQIVRWLYRIKKTGSGQAVFTRGWGG